MPALAEPAKPSNLGEAVVASLQKANLDPATLPAGGEPEPERKKTAPEPKQEPEKKEPAKAPVEDKKQVVPGEAENPNLAPARPKEAKENVKQPVDDEPPKGMTKEAQQAFAEMRKARHTAEKQVETFAAEREQFETKLREAAASAPEIVKLRAELEEARKALAANEDEISIVRVESTPLYKQQVGAPLEEVEETVARLATTYDLSPESIMAAVREPDHTKRSEAIEDLIGDFRTLDKDALSDAVKTYARAHKIGEDLRTNARKKLDEITASSTKEEEQSLAAAVGEYRAGIASEWKALQTSRPDLRTVDGAQAWNDHLAALQRKAEALDVNTMPAAEVAKHVARSIALDEEVRVIEHYRKREKDLTEKLDKAEARIKEYVGTEPGAGAGQNGDGASQPAGPSDMGSRVMGRVGALARS